MASDEEWVPSGNDEEEDDSEMMTDESIGKGVVNVRSINDNIPLEDLELKYNIKARAKGKENKRLQGQFTPLIVHNGFFRGHASVGRVVPWKAAPCLKLRNVMAVCEGDKEGDETSVKVIGYTYDVPVINYQPKGGLCWNITGLSPDNSSNQRYAPKKLIRTTPLHNRVTEKPNNFTIFTEYNTLPFETFNFNTIRHNFKGKRKPEDPLYNKTECEELGAMRPFDYIMRLNNTDEIGQKSFNHIVKKILSIEPNKIAFIGMYRPKLKKYWPPTLELGRLCIKHRDLKRRSKRKNDGKSSTNASFDGRRNAYIRTRPLPLLQSQVVLHVNAAEDDNEIVEKQLDNAIGEVAIVVEKDEELLEKKRQEEVKKRARKILRTHFTRKKRYRDQLRAQIMALKYLLGNENPPPKLLADVLQQGADGNEFGSSVDTRGRVKRWNRTHGDSSKRRSGKRRYRLTKKSTADGDESWNSRASRGGGRPKKRAKKPTEEVITLEQYGGIKEDFELAKKIRRQKKQRQAYELSKRRLEIIIACRLRDLSSSEGGGQTIEFLVKFKRESYLTGCLWVEPSMIAMEGDTDGCEAMDDWLRDEDTVVEQWENAKVKARTDYFKPEWTEIDRILACRVDYETVQMRGEYGSVLKGQTTSKESRKYLVKWKNLSYALSTWEEEDAIEDEGKIAQFHRFNYPPRLKNAPPIFFRDVRPPASAWAKYNSSPIYKDGLKLRPYQVEGLNWLNFCWFQRRSCILADEMGLGKTVQAVSFLEHLKTRQNVRGPFLVIAPLATLEHWKREFESWTDLNVVLYHASEGGRETREMIQKYEWHYPTGTREQQRLIKFNVLLTSYELVSSDFDDLFPIDWRCIIVDEAHRLKNLDSQLALSLNEYHFDHLVLMTGTPLQNDMLELWALLHFIEPENFSNAQAFVDQFGQMTDANSLAALHDRLRPYMLRRLKEDVEKSIPAKEETIVNVELTIKQKKYYRAIFERNRGVLTGGLKKSNGKVGVTGEKRKSGPSLINLEMQMRKCCCHPYMIDGVEANETDECFKKSIAEGKATTRANEIEHMIHCSGKMILLHKLFPKLRKEGHRILIFSQFRGMLGLIGLLLEYHGLRYERLDGMVRGIERQRAIDRFDTDTDIFAFLLSTKAGGVGLNLQSADTVIIYDSDWNPQNDIQAQARAHRIGQTKSVRVYRLVTNKTYEAEMFARASRKLGLSTAVFRHGSLEGNTTGSLEDDVDDQSTNSGGMMSLLTMDKDEVEMLLRYGAYAILDKDDSSAEQFTEATIDKLLEKSTTIRYGGKTDDNPRNSNDKDNDSTQGSSSTSTTTTTTTTNATRTSETKKSSVPSLSLAKASFMASTEDGDVNFGDENFWEKVLGPKPVDRLMKFIRDGQLEKATEDETRNFLHEVGEMARGMWLRQAEGRKHEDAEGIMNVLIELKVRGRKANVAHGKLDQRELAAYWIDVIENSRRRRNKLAKSYKNAKPINVYGKKWGLYGYSDDEYDDSEEASSIVANGHNNKSNDVTFISDDEEMIDVENGKKSIIDEPFDEENEVSGYVSGISLRINTTDFSNIRKKDFEVVKLPKILRGGQFVMRNITKESDKLKVSQAIKVLKMLLMDPQSLAFRFPIDTSKLFDYDKYIKEDHCLMSILESLKNGLYGRANSNETFVSSQFFRDLNLVWYNCILYNKDGSFITEIAKRMHKKADMLLGGYFHLNRSGIQTKNSEAVK